MAKDKYPEAPNKKAGARRLSQEMSQVAAGIADLARVRNLPVERAKGMLGPRSTRKVRVFEFSK